MFVTRLNLRRLPLSAFSLPLQTNRAGDNAAGAVADVVEAVVLARKSHEDRRLRQNPADSLAGRGVPKAAPCRSAHTPAGL